MAIEIQASYSVSGWEGDRLKRRVVDILTDYAAAIDKQLKEEIKTVQFPWPGITYRRNGTIEGSPRDIVDLGNFWRSQKRNRISATEVRFTWGNSVVTYAGIILKGRSDTAAYPGRNWIEPALKALPFESFFAQEWPKRFSK